MRLLPDQTALELCILLARQQHELPVLIALEFHLRSLRFQLRPLRFQLGDARQRRGQLSFQRGDPLAVPTTTTTPLTACTLLQPPARSTKFWPSWTIFALRAHHLILWLFPRPSFH